MDKKHPTYGHDEDGFMRLIPREHHATGCSIHEGQDSAEYWKNRCLHAEKKYNSLKRKTNTAYGRAGQVQDLTDEEAEEELERLEAEYDALDARDAALSSIDDPQLSVGIGVSFGPEMDPRLYRLSDRDGELSSGEKFVGGEVEIQPGRGFHIGFHWRKK